jgi:hypothetical protein
MSPQLRASFSPTTLERDETRSLPTRGLSDSYFLSREGVAKAALDCAHQ